MEPWKADIRFTAPSLGNLVSEVQYLREQNDKLQESLDTLKQQVMSKSTELTSSQLKTLNAYADRMAEQLKVTQNLYEQKEVENSKLEARLEITTEELKYIKQYKMSRLNDELTEANKRIAHLEAKTGDNNLMKQESLISSDEELDEESNTKQIKSEEPHVSGAVKLEPNYETTTSQEYTSPSSDSESTDDLHSTVKVEDTVLQEPNN